MWHGGRTVAHHHGCPFLSITPDTRGEGLADCGVASEADAYSMYYNPAKYAFIGSNTTADLGVYYRKPVRLGGLDARLRPGLRPL